MQRDGGVERSLTTQGRQESIGAFLGDDAFHELRGDRFYVCGVREIGIGHDRGRVRVDQDHPESFGLQDSAGLGAGVVELAGLTDDDGAGADDKDRRDVSSTGHGSPGMSR